MKIKKAFEDGKYIGIIYCLCTIGIMWTGVWRDIGSGAQWALSNNCIGLFVFPMIVCRFNLKDFVKLPYFIWIVLFSVLVYPAYSYLKPGTDYNAQILCALINVGLYGIVAIRILYYVFKDKEFKVKRVSILFWFWAVMFLWAVLSVCKTLYPLWFLVMFGALYISDSSDDKSYKMISGITTGIIISFFWIQGRAFLYRPYDTGARYYGHFTNPSINCMFYLTVYAAWLHKTILSRQKKTSKLIVLVLFVFTFSMLDFVYLAGSRGGVLSAALMTLVYLLIDVCRVSDHKIKRFLISGLSVAMIAILMFVPVYACVRYIPALRHHPVWYRDYSEDKVHSWDPIDSEKYTSLKTALSNFLNMRDKTFGAISEPNDQDVVTSDEILNDSVVIVTPEEYSDYNGFIYVYSYSDGVEPGTDESHPAGYFSEDSTDRYMGVSGVRKYIYRYFVQRLNLFGHEEVYPSVQFGDSLGLYGHTHNAFLQIAYCFGIPSGIAFVLLCIGGLAYPFVKARKDKTGLPDIAFSIVFLVAFASYGMIDCLSLTGNIMYSIFFLALLPFMKNPAEV